MFSAIASRTKTTLVQPVTLALLTGCLALMGACDKQPPTPPPIASTDQGSGQVPSPNAPSPPEPRDLDSLALAPLDFSNALPPQAKSAAWRPSLQEVEQAVEATLDERGESHGVARDPSSGSAHPATMHYAALELPAAPNSEARHMVSASFDLQGRPRNWSSSRIERIDMLDELPPDEAARKALVMRVIDQATSALLLRQKIAMTPDASLVDAVEAIEALPVEVAIDTTQRLRDARKTSPDTIPTARATRLLRHLATRQDPTLVPLVFTALHEYGALDGLGPLMVEAATHASKNQQLPVFLSLLSQMATVSDDATRAYLESVASGHPEEVIREIARESLEKRPSANPK